VRRRSSTLAFALLALISTGVIVGLFVYWPDRGAAAPPTNRVLVQSADVVGVSSEGCAHLIGPDCRLIRIVLTEGPYEGRRSYFALPAEEFAPALSPGDRVRVQRNGPLRPDELEDPESQPFAFVDFERGRALYVLVFVFAMATVVLAGWQGFRSLIGLVISLVVVVGWIVPAILSGEPPIAIALIGGLAVTLATTALTHGTGLKSAAAVLGASATLVLIVAMSLAAVDLAHIAGLASEESNLLDARAEGNLSIHGLVIAGIVIGALGVLDDVTISQSSTVLALRRADPAMPRRRVFREAMAVGRDHLGATVNTLVLAYTGASLPLLLIFAGQSTPFFEAVGYEAVAEEIVATLVGSTGLVAAVPLTTGLATLLTVQTEQA
jgi:uncharacterized membrane protein